MIDLSYSLMVRRENCWSNFASFSQPKKQKKQKQSNNNKEQKTCSYKVLNFVAIKFDQFATVG